jgi:dethiobiotin synthetase
MRAAGARVRAHKPAVTGTFDPSADPGQSEWPSDDVLLAHAAGMEAQEVAPLRYRAAASPLLASALEGERIDPAQLVARALEGDGTGGADEEILIVEGVGGLLVPLAEEYAICDFAAELGMPLLVAARPGLGTINHTLLTLRAARAAGLSVRAVVLTPWPACPGTLERSNRAQIERLGDIEVAVLRNVRGPDLAELERAGRWLPWRRWLEQPPRASRRLNGSRAHARA